MGALNNPTVVGAKQVTIPTLAGSTLALLYFLGSV